MSTPGFLNFSSEKEFAVKLVNYLSKDIPPDLMENKKKSLTVNRITRLLERTYNMALEYRNARNIGFLRRAILANSFKWNLRNKGYGEDFIDMATEGLVLTLTNGAVPASNQS